MFTPPEKEIAVKITANHLLLGLGGLMIAGELILGAVTGFDLALLGLAIAAGGGIGLFFASTKIGLFAAGALSFIYVVFLRRWLRTQLTVADRPSNVDALIGRSGVVVERIAPHEAGHVKLGDEEWRAVLAASATAPKEQGESVTVESVEGVTLHVR